MELACVAQSGFCCPQWTLGVKRDSLSSSVSSLAWIGPLLLFGDALGTKT